MTSKKTKTKLKKKTTNSAGKRSGPRTKKITSKKKSTKFNFQNGVVLLIVLLVFSLLAMFMTQKFLEPTNLAKLLPEDQTLGFITVNTNDLVTQTNLPDDYYLSPDKLKEMVAGYLNQESFDLLQTWFKGQVAVAYLTTSTQEVEKVYFFDYLNRPAAEDFLNSLLLPEETLEKEPYFSSLIYSYPMSQNFSATFVSGYLVIAENSENLQLIIDSASGDSLNLKSSSAYNTVADNLPYNPTVVTYWDIDKNQDFLTDFIPVYDIMPEELVKPVLSIFPAFGAAVEATDDGFYIQTYIAVEKKMLQDEDYFNMIDKYRANLTEYIPENPTFFWGGQDLKSESNRLIGLFEQFHESAAVIFEAILRGKAQEYFGDNISLEDDIYPLLEEEYALSIYEDDAGNRDYLALLALGDQEEKQIYVDTLKQGFLEQQIYSDPYIQTYTLGDGSTGRELVADLVEITVDSMTYEDVDIDVFSLSNGNILGYMTVFADNFAFASSLPILQHSIDLMKGPNGSLSASPDMEAINEIMMSADEASFIDLATLRDSELWGMEFFSAFSDISSTKNFFNDGVATFHLVRY